MNKEIDKLIKLKLEEKPPKEYFENYRRNLESKLAGVTAPGKINGSYNLLPRFSFVFNGVLLALLIFLGGLIYAQNQQIKSLQFTQEETQNSIYKYLSSLRMRIESEMSADKTGGNVQTPLIYNRIGQVNKKRSADSQFTEFLGYYYKFYGANPLEIGRNSSDIFVRSPESDRFLMGQKLEKSEENDVKLVLSAKIKTFEEGGFSYE